MARVAKEKVSETPVRKTNRRAAAKRSATSKPVKTALRAQTRAVKSPALPAASLSLSNILPKKVRVPSLSQIRNYRPSKIIYLALVIIVLALLVSYKKSWFIAATVNGSPISNFSLLDRMNQQYRASTLDEMVNEKIIADAARKQNITVSPAEVDAKVTELEGNVGGAAALDSLLSQQGQTRGDLRSQLEILLMMEKMYANEATVSADEVNQFIASNKSQMTATDSAGQIKEATDAIKQQKLNQIYSQKFQDLKQQAQVQIFP